MPESCFAMALQQSVCLVAESAFRVFVYMCSELCAVITTCFTAQIAGDLAVAVSVLFFFSTLNV